MIGSDPDEDRFPSTSTSRTTIADTEVILAEGPYRAVVTFIKEDPLSVGALVTTHKIDLFAAAKDLFDELDPLALLMDEVSCLSKRGTHFRAHAKDPISSGHALDAFLPAGYFESEPTDLVIFGAGGSAIAIDWYLTRPTRGADPCSGAHARTSR